MSKIRPFMGFRPTKELCERVAALPYDVMNSAEAREMVKDNPYSFLHVDKAEIDLPEGTDIHSDAVYKKASENLNNMIKDGVYIQDGNPCLYIYKLTMNGKSQAGLVTCTSIDEYTNGSIKKHELTRADKEEDRIRHVDSCNANTGPIFLTYKSKKDIDAIINNWMATNQAIYDFKAEDGIDHTVWIIDDNAVINELISLFKDVPSLYIADGHHRNASAVKVGLRRREELNNNYDPEAEFNFYLSVLFPDDQLYIMDYNRVVTDLNGYSSEEFLDQIKAKFDVTIYTKNEAYRPDDKHKFGMYLDKKWYILTAKADIVDDSDPVKCLDVSILQRELLTPILGINDPRTDDRIDFIGGIRGLNELEKRVNSGEMKVAFSMYPTTMNQLMDIADAGEIMPPKSTWFEPKLRSGIFVHKLS